VVRRVIEGVRVIVTCILTTDLLHRRLAQASSEVTSPSSSTYRRSSPSEMSAVFLELLGCRIAAKPTSLRGSVRFASSIRQPPTDKSLRLRHSSSSTSVLSSVSRQRRGARTSMFSQQGTGSTRRSFSTSFTLGTPRNTLGRIEPKRIVVEIPRINRYESVWKPILVSTIHIQFKRVSETL
jgi:hypothetical protein